MDKLYSTIYYITIDKDKIVHNPALPWMWYTVDDLKNPTIIFDKFKEFVPLIKDNKVSWIKWKLLSLVTEELIIESLSDWNVIYFMDVKWGTTDELDKKGGTIYTTRFEPLPEQSKMLLDFFVWFCLETVTDLPEQLILKLRFFFITRSKLSIEASMENILEKCYHMWTVQQEAKIEEKKLDDFQSKLDRIIFYGNSLPRSEFSAGKGTANELPTKLAVSMKNDIKSTMIQYVKNTVGNRKNAWTGLRIWNTMDVEELEMIIEWPAWEKRVEIDLDDEDFIREFVVRVKADNILADSCINLTDFRKKCIEFYIWDIQSTITLWNQ